MPRDLSKKVIRKLFPGFWSEYRRLHEKVDVLGEQIQRLGPGFCAGRKVDLVNFDIIRCFMFMDDFGYRDQVQESQKNYQLTQDDIREIQERRSAKQRSAAPSLDEALQRINRNHVIHVLLAHYWAHRLDFTYIDVGCGYGHSALIVAHSICACDMRNKTICFEPGVAAFLVGHNIAINGLEDFMIFETVAVSSGTFPVIMYCEAGFTAGNRTVNRIPGRESFSYVVPATSIDEYLEEKNVRNHLIMKIDTEGAEYEVFLGMRRAIEERYTTYFVEFTPPALATRIRPAQFLADIGRDAYILDIETLEFDPRRNNMRPFKVIEPSRYKRFVEEVSSRQGSWTDLLVVPRKLPGVEGLMARLTGAD